MWANSEQASHCPSYAAESPEAIGEAIGLGALVMPLIQDLLLAGILIKPGAECMTYGMPVVPRLGLRPVKEHPAAEVRVVQPADRQGLSALVEK